MVGHARLKAQQQKPRVTKSKSENLYQYAYKIAAQQNLHRMQYMPLLFLFIRNKDHQQPTKGPLFS